MTETWRALSEYNEIEVSSLGRVKRAGVLFEPTVRRNRRTGRPESSVVGFKKDGQWRTVFVHRLVLEAFVGPRPPGTVCCHADGDPTNNRLDNLRWDTQRANIHDAMAHGTFVNAPGFTASQRGEGNLQAKLTEADVLDIRKRAAAGETRAATGRAYGLHPAYVTLIVKRRRWAHVSEPEA